MFEETDLRPRESAVVLSEECQNSARSASTTPTSARSPRSSPSGGGSPCELEKDGREITVDFRRYSAENLRLGYAATNFAAQGASLPHVHGLMGGSDTDLHEGYVQVSRGIKSSHLFVDKHTAGGPELADLLRSPRPGAAEDARPGGRRPGAAQAAGAAPQPRRERGISIGL